MTVAPTGDRPVRVRLKCPDAEDFVERFAPNVTRGGIFLPTRETRAVGASIRFELALADNKVVLAGEGVVTWAKPKGLGVKFTTVDPASEWMLERLLARRQAATAAAPAATAAAPAAPAAAPAAPSESAAVPISDRHLIPDPPPLPPPLPPLPLAGERRGEGTPAAGTPAAGTPAAGTPAAGTPSERLIAPPDSAPVARPQDRKRALVRASVGLTALFVCAGVVWASVGRARLGARAPGEPAKPATPAPSEAVPPPPEVAAPEPGPPAPPAAEPPARAHAEPPPASARPGGLQVERMLVGASYKRHTCPNPTRRLSVKSTRTVNVCLEVAHRQGKAERLTLFWERNGTFAGKTRMQIPAARANVRTRAHMKINRNRLGAWSVRAVSDRNASLAETTFDVVP